MKISFLFLLVVSFGLLSFDQPAHCKISYDSNSTFASQVNSDGTSLRKIDYDTIIADSLYPFTVTEDGSHTVLAEIESEDLFVKYLPIFEKYGYSGNGYSWEGIIRQILEKIDPSLLRHLHFNSEGGAFFVDADSEATQQKFLLEVSPIFRNIPRLEQYLKTADRRRVSD